MKIIIIDNVKFFNLYKLTLKHRNIKNKLNNPLKK